MIKKIIYKISRSIAKKFGYKLVQKNNENLNFQFPEYSDDELRLIEISKKNTMTSYQKLNFLLRSIEHVYNNKIDGDFVECGVWKGGNIILFKNMINKLNMQNKKIYAFDTFEGMTKPSDIDVDLRFKQEKAEDVMERSPKDYNIHNIHSYYPIEKVKKNIIESCNDLENIKFIKGDVLKTLLISDNIPEKISILRLDTDWYESTKIELEILFPKLVNNGILIIDDYGDYKGCKKAVDEYFRDKKFNIFKIDSGGRMLIKSS